jgi:hypothetical protein
MALFTPAALAQLIAFYSLLLSDLLYFSGYTDGFVLLAVIPVAVYTNADLQKFEIMNENRGKPDFHLPVATYENPDISKKLIMQENKGLSGVYCWTNKINGKFYIGSAVDLQTRLAYYYSKKSMETSLKKSKSAIYSAILKHGQSNFKLEILEYCSSEKCIKLEQKHINFFKPEYNILQIAGSCLGVIRSGVSRAKISAAKIGNTHSNSKSHPNSIKIQVTDLEINTKTIYHSVNSAAKALNIHPYIISGYFNRNQIKPYKGRYVFTRK